MRRLCGFSSLEDRLQWDIKAAPRFLSAANYIKELLSLALDPLSSPAASLFSAVFEITSEFVTRGSTQIVNILRMSEAAARTRLTTQGQGQGQGRGGLEGGCQRFGFPFQPQRFLR